MPPKAYSKKDPNSRPDTRPALKLLIGRLGGVVSVDVAESMGTSPSAVYHGLSRKTNPPTLDTLAVYARNVFHETGVRFRFTVDPETGVTVEPIEKGAPLPVDGHGGNGATSGPSADAGASPGRVEAIAG